MRRRLRLLTWLWPVVLISFASCALFEDDEAGEEEAAQEQAAEGEEEGGGKGDAAGEGDAEGEAGKELSPEEAAKAKAADAAAKAKADKMASMGVVDAVKGAPNYLRGGAKKPLTKGTEVVAKDRVETGKAGKARVRLKDESVLALGPKTSVVLGGLSTSADGRQGRLKVVAGKFWLNVTKWTGGGKSYFEIDTPNATAGIRGTTVWGDTKKDIICSLDGVVEVRSKKKKKAKPAVLKAGQCVSKMGKGKLKRSKPKPKQVKRYLRDVTIE